MGPYVIAVSLVSPFIKFKNASKETVDASDELVDELRLALIQAGQKLSRHIKAEARAEDLEEKRRHIEQFGPILVEGLCRITGAPDARKKKAEQGLMKILGRDSKAVEKELAVAVEGKEALVAKQQALLGIVPDGEKEKASDQDIIEVKDNKVTEKSGKDAASKEAASKETKKEKKPKKSKSAKADKRL
jgi:DNA topoisomerase-6 subunit B